MDFPPVEWRRIAVSGQLPQGRSGHACCQLGSRIVVLGGGGDSVYFHDVNVYSTGDSKWTSPKINGTAPEGRAYHSAAVAGDKVYLFGGWKGDQFLNDLHVLEGETHDLGIIRWSRPETTGAAPGPRAYHTATVFQGKLILFGGWFMEFCNDVTVLDTATMEWSLQPVKGPLPQARAAHSATLVGSRLFVFGGESERGRLHDVHVLDLESWEWSAPETAGAHPTPRSGHTATAVGKWVVIFAGWDGDKHLQGTHALDTDTMTWITPKPATADAISPSVRSGHSCNVVGGEMYVVGGWDRSCFLNDVWVLGGWDPRGWPRGAGSPEEDDGAAGLGGGVVDLICALRAEGLGLLEGDPTWAGGCGGVPPGELEELAIALVEAAARRVAAPGGGGGGGGEGVEPGAEGSENGVRLALECMGLSDGAGPAPPEPVGGRGRPPTGSRGGSRGGSPPPPTPAPTPTILRQLSGSNERSFSRSGSFKGQGQGSHALHDAPPGPRLPWLDPLPRPAPAGEGGAGRGSSLLEVVEAAMGVRAVLGQAAELHALLEGEVASLRRHRGEVNSLAAAVDVQPLFSTYGELMRAEQSIRSYALAGSADAAQAEATRRDALHATCRATAARLERDLERVTGKQRERADHLQGALREIRAAQGRLEQLAGEEVADAEGGEHPAAGSPRADLLPEFFFEGDALAALEGVAAQYRDWQEKSYLPVRAAMEETNRALVALRAAAAREARAAAAAGGLPGLAEGGARARALAAAGGDFLAHLVGESREAELEHTQSLLADCSSLSSKLAAVDEQRLEIGELKEELQGVSRDVLQAKEALIKMNAEAELTRLRHACGSGQVDAAESDLARQQAHVEALAGRQEEIRERLAELARRDHPELLCEPGGELSSRLRHTGLVVARKLTHYEQVKLLKDGSRHVFLVRYNRRLCVLKEISNEDEASRKVFENEVTLLWKLRHPAIVSVEAVFYEGLRAYIQMPYVEGGTMRQWIAAEPKPWELQSVFRQLLQGLAYLHDHGVVHRDLKLDNVLMSGEGRPVICDLGISKDHSTLLELSNTSTRGEGRTSAEEQRGAAPGTEGYIAPEVLDGHGATPAADMWSVGVMLYRAQFGEGPPDLPPREAAGRGGPGGPGIPPHENEELRALLQGMLAVDPARRISANEALSFPYFATSVVRKLLDNKEILESDAKLEIIREHVRGLQEGRSAVSMRVRRGQLVGDVVSIFREMQRDTLLYPLKVRFIGEAGVDAGGLTSDLYTEFFNRLLQPEHALFEAPPEEDTPLSGAAFLPAGGLGGEAIDTLRMVGRILVKSIVDRRPIPARFAPSFFKYLLGHEPNLRDLELYDRTLAVHLRELLIKPVEGLGIYREVPVTDANKVEYVQERAREVLVGCREPALAAIKEGFGSVDLSSYLPMLTCTDLMLLVRGEEHIDAQMITALVAFHPPSWAADSRTPGDFLALLEELRPNDLRRFLRLATSQCSIPRGGGGGGGGAAAAGGGGGGGTGAGDKGPGPITIHRCPKSERLPIGRTCFRRVDLPDYQDAGVLRQKMLLALASIDGSGFYVL